MSDRPPWFADRTTGELLILGMAGTVCAAILFTGALLGILAIVQPERDIAQGFAALASVISTLISLVAGFLAGRTDSRQRERRVSADE